LQAAGAATDQPSLNAARAAVIAAKATPEEAGRIPMQWSPANMAAFNQAQMTAEQRATQARETDAAAALAANRAAELAQGKQRIGIESARLGIEQQRLKNEQATQGVFAGMAPQERTRAETAYSKDTKDYTDSVASARGVQNLIAEAQGGNKAAPGLIPIAELRQYVNRINATELKAVGTGAGSALDQIQGWLQGKTEGQPIPPEILQATMAVSQAQEKLSYQKYLARLATNKVTYGVQPPPIDVSGIYGPAPGGAQPAAPALPAAAAAQLRKGANTVFGNGQVWTLDATGKPQRIK
jgi:hypothetical protein